LRSFFRGSRDLDDMQDAQDGQGLVLLAFGAGLYPVIEVA
jgi:hypothetical protein